MRGIAKSRREREMDLAMGDWMIKVCECLLIINWIVFY